MFNMIVAVGVTVDNSAWQRPLHKLAPQTTPENFAHPV
jgi:hypothetical protein